MEAKWLYTSLFFLLALPIFKFLIQSFTNPRAKKLPPSPPSLPFIGHLHLLKDPIHRTMQNLSRKFGPIYSLRFGSRPVVVVSSPSLAEECLSKNDVVFANRPHLLMGKYLGYNFNILVTAPYGEHWRNLRKISSLELLSPTRINLFAHIRRDEIKQMLVKLYKCSQNGFSKVELKSVFSDLTLNNLLRMLAGKRYCGEDVKDCEEAMRFTAIIKEVLEFAGASNPGDFLPILKWIDYGGYVKRIKTLAKKTDAFLQGLVDEHRNGGSRVKSDETTVDRFFLCKNQSHSIILMRLLKDFY